MYCSLRPAKVVMLICMLLFRPLRLLLVGFGYLLHSSLGFQLPQLYLTMVRADNGWPDNFPSNKEHREEKSERTMDN